MSHVSSAGARRPPRVNVHRRKPAVPPMRLTARTMRSTRDRRVRRRSAVEVHVQSSSWIRDSGPRLPLAIELARSVLLVVVAVLVVVVVLPALLELAAAAFH